MSREAMVAHACFDCRQAFKLAAARGREPKVCPRCTGTLHWMGPFFTAPPRSKQASWNVIQTLYAHGYRFYDPRELGGAPLPSRLREVDEFLRENPEHPFRVAEPDGTLLPRTRPPTARPAKAAKRAAPRSRGARH